MKICDSIGIGIKFLVLKSTFIEYHFEIQSGLDEKIFLVIFKSL